MNAKVKPAPITIETGFERDEVAELCCNLDDMTGEDIGFAVDIMLASGALDAWTTPIYMKKNRPAVLLTCLCPASESGRFEQLLLKHTSTLGVRKKVCERCILKRELTTCETSLGTVRVKCSRLPDGTVREKPEHDCLVELAGRHNMSLSEVRKAVGQSLEK